MVTFFLDTSFVIALELKDDQRHQAAKTYWQSMAITSPQLVTTSYVFDEIVTFFNSRSRHDKAVDQLSPQTPRAENTENQPQPQQTSSGKQDIAEPRQLTSFRICRDQRRTHN